MENQEVQSYSAHPPRTRINEEVNSEDAKVVEQATLPTPSTLKDCVLFLPVKEVSTHVSLIQEKK